MSASTSPSAASVPPFLYGTAWKEERTRDLVLMALEAGFRGIDTANQRRHYHEAGVGEGLADAIARGMVKRDDVFIQTKFTHLPGQDHRLPYERDAPVGAQVAQSARSSLAHLGIERIDSLVLHGPVGRGGLHAADVEAWQAMESLHDQGLVRMLGVSNVSSVQLEQLCELARVAPTFVQNRCFARVGWDANVRAVCRERGLTYQGFSLLTANPEVLSDPRVRSLAARLDATVAQVVFRFAVAIGMLPLTGTTDPEHAREDLAALALDLGPDDVALIEALSAPPRS